MDLKEFFTGWIWNLIVGFINILAFIGFKMDFIAIRLNQISPASLGQYFLLVLALFFFVRAILIKSKGISEERLVLKNIADNKRDKECALWNYGKYDYSVVQANYTWQEWIRELIKTVDRPDLDYYNFGDEYHFFDLSTAKKIVIPTGNRARTEKVGNVFRNGMVLRLMSEEN